MDHSTKHKVIWQDTIKNCDVEAKIRVVVVGDIETKTTGLVVESYKTFEDITGVRTSVWRPVHDVSIANGIMTLCLMSLIKERAEYITTPLPSMDDPSVYDHFFGEKTS